MNTDRTELIQANFTVIMSNGIGLQVGELQKSNILQLDVMIPAQSFVSIQLKNTFNRRILSCFEFAVLYVYVIPDLLY